MTNYLREKISGLQGLLHDESELALVPVGISVRGQQQADHGLRADATHHLHHQGGGIHGNRARTTIATCSSNY